MNDSANNDDLKDDEIESLIDNLELSDVLGQCELTDDLYDHFVASNLIKKEDNGSIEQTKTDINQKTNIVDEKKQKSVATKKILDMLHPVKVRAVNSSLRDNKNVKVGQSLRRIRNREMYGIGSDLTSKQLIRSVLKKFFKSPGFNSKFRKNPSLKKIILGAARNGIKVKINKRTKSAIKSKKTSFKIPADITKSFKKITSVSSVKEKIPKSPSILSNVSSVKEKIPKSPSILSVDSR